MQKRSKAGTLVETLIALLGITLPGSLKASVPDASQTHSEVSPLSPYSDEVIQRAVNLKKAIEKEDKNLLVYLHIVSGLAKPMTQADFLVQNKIENLPFALQEKRQAALKDYFDATEAFGNHLRACIVHGAIDTPQEEIDKLPGLRWEWDKSFFAVSEVGGFNQNFIAQPANIDLPNVVTMLIAGDAELQTYTTLETARAALTEIGQKSSRDDPAKADNKDLLEKELGPHFAALAPDIQRKYLATVRAGTDEAFLLLLHGVEKRGDTYTINMEKIGKILAQIVKILHSLGGVRSSETHNAHHPDQPVKYKPLSPKP